MAVVVAVRVRIAADRSVTQMTGCEQWQGKEQVLEWFVKRVTLGAPAFAAVVVVVDDDDDKGVVVEEGMVK